MRIFKKTKSENIVKNQHYIPEALLRHFTNTEGKLCEALLQSKKIYFTVPSNSMCEKFAYEYSQLKRNTVEKYFGRIETEVVPLVKSLIQLVDQYKKHEVEFSKVKESVEQLLPIFIIFYYRSGALLTEFSSINKNEKIPLLSEKILNDQYINLLAKTIKDCYKFAIIESDGDFLMSDQFVSTSALRIKSQFYNISNRHIGLKDTLILIPISSSYYVVYWHSTTNFIIDSDQLNILNEENIKLFNEAIINNSYVKCVAQKQERIEQVIDEYKWSSPTQIYAGGNPSGYFMGAIKKKEIFFFKEEMEAFELLEHMTIMRYKGLGRNDQCACNSRRKFKKCHENAYKRIQVVMQSFGRSPLETRIAMGIPEAIVFERPIDEWSGYGKAEK